VRKTGDEIEAQVVQTDPANDIALLKIDAKTAAIPMSETGQLRRGDEVLTLGYPLVVIQGQEQKATFGRINSLTGLRDDARLIQIDVPIQPGNSGGPLLDRKGQVVGIVTSTLNQIVAMRASGSLPQNVNFAMKSDYALPMLRMALDKGLAASSPGTTQDMAQIVADREAAVVLVIAR
jgi:S1-C subfamily serine protease